SAPNRSGSAGSWDATAAISASVIAGSRYPPVVASMPLAYTSSSALSLIAFSSQEDRGPHGVRDLGVCDVVVRAGTKTLHLRDVLAALDVVNLSTLEDVWLIPVEHLQIHRLHTGATRAEGAERAVLRELARCERDIAACEACRRIRLADSRIVLRLRRDNRAAHALGVDDAAN